MDYIFSFLKLLMGLWLLSVICKKITLQIYFSKFLKLNIDDKKRYLIYEDVQCLNNNKNFYGDDDFGDKTAENVRQILRYNNSQLNTYFIQFSKDQINTYGFSSLINIYNDTVTQSRGLEIQISPQSKEVV